MLVVSDLDGTLAQSKAAIDSEIGTLLSALLRVVKVTVISGGALPQFKALASPSTRDADLGTLSLLPTSGTRFFAYTDEWRKLYSEDPT